jgi:hypothetical protein
MSGRPDWGFLCFLLSNSENKNTGISVKLPLTDIIRVLFIVPEFTSWYICHSSVKANEKMTIHHHT